MSDTISALQREMIIVNGYATTDLTQEQLAQWAKDLTYVSCYSYGYTMNGDLVPADDEEFLQNAARSGVAPLMVLTPFNEAGEYSYDLVKVIFTDPRVRDRLINNVFLTVAEKNYYGMVFNFGYIAEEDKDQFVITVAKAAARLNRRGDLVIVSILSGINDAGIDYESLGRAANFLELRGFYWEQANEPPSPVLPIDRVRQILNVVLGLTDPRNILLGLSNFGFDWSLPYGRGPAEMIFQMDAEERARITGADVQYDEIAQSPFYTYIDDTGSRHEVWYEDVSSTRLKVELVGELGLSGISIWTIMKPFPAATQAINELYIVKKV